MKQPDLDERIAITQRPGGRTAVMYQSWVNLLFLHWEVDPAIIQQTLPPGLYVDTHEGKAWLAVVPFFMQGLRPRFCPAIPGLSNFLELNLRTYVYDRHGKPGVWFYSLDADQRIAVMIARTVFKLPYIHARMQSQIGPDNWIQLLATRPGHGTQSFRYRNADPLGTAPPGSLEFFLVERYSLFAYNTKSKTLLRGRIHHTPYQLARPEVSEYSTQLFPMNGFADPGRPPDHALACEQVDVTVYGFEDVTGIPET